jgi:ABC-2 type transport system ATP-binding protein
MKAVELQHVVKTFDEHVAVDDLSLAVPKGSVYGFIGPNGSGKTTTLRMIMNILFPDRGDILIFNERMHGSCNERIGYMPEERGLYKRMKVRELLIFLTGLKQRKVDAKTIDSWLERLDLIKWANEKVETLSKGMSQKVQFIATVASRPDLVILDEPFSGLDPLNTEVIKDAILELQQTGTTVIFSTHDMGMAERMCDYIFMIFKGQKVLDGTLESIKAEYGHDTLRIRGHHGDNGLDAISGVAKINNSGNEQEIRLKPEADPHEVILKILEKTRLQSFEIVQPSLHDIFIRIAGNGEKGGENE